MSFWTGFVIAITCFVGGALQTLLGFGCAIVMMALIPYVIPQVPLVAGLTNVICLGCSAYLVIKNKRIANIKLLIPVYVVYMIVMPLANNWSVNMNEGVLRLLLGIVLFALAIYYAFFASKALKLPRNIGVAAGIGVTSGILSGMFTVGGPPVVIYTMSAAESKEEYLGMIQPYLMMTNLYGTIVRIQSGVISFSMFDWILVAAVGVAGGMFLGVKLQNKFNWEKIRKGVYILVGFVGITNIVEGIQSIL